MPSSSGSSRSDRVRVGEVRVRVWQRRHLAIDLARRPGDVAPRFPEVDLHRRAGKRAAVHEGLLRLPPRDHVDQRGRDDLARRLRRRGPPRRRKKRGRVRRGHLLDRGDAALRRRYVTALHCSGRPPPADLTRRADPHAPVHHRRPCSPRNRPVDDWGRLLGQVRSPQSGAPGSRPPCQQRTP